MIATAGSAYQWFVTGGNITSGQGTNQVNIDWATSGNYSVAVVETNTYGCVGDSVIFNIVINPLPAANAGADVAICSGQSTNLNASGGTIYSWSPAGGLSDTSIANPVANPAGTTTYIVNVTDANGCLNTDTITVTVNSLPVVTTSASPSAIICIGSSTDLTATGGTSYLWSSGASTATVSVSPVSSTTYTVTVTDANSCSSTDSIAVTVNALPVVIASTDVLICDSSSTVLSASGAISYQWSPATGLDNSASASPIASPNTTITYTVTGTDANGCENTDQVNCYCLVRSHMHIFTDSAIANCGGVTVTFTDGSLNADSYSWNFGDGTFSNEQNPVHQYNFASNNIVTFIVGNGGLCYDTLSVPLSLLSLSDYLKNTPNVFTPNNDGYNDCFSLNGIGDFKSCTTIKIFDRWGYKGI